MNAVLNLSVAVLCVISNYIRVIAAQEPWHYDDQENWPGDCNIGKSQSPIDISEDLVNLTDSIGSLKYTLWDEPTAVSVENNGHTVLVTISGEVKPMLSGGGLNGTYNFENLHFHWPSEHTIEKKRFHLEAHFVFRKFKNNSVASEHNDDFAVLSVFYELIKNEGPSVFKELANATEKVSEEVNSKTTTGPIVFQDLLPNISDTFYHYRGSLTTPDCNEVVSWFILKNIGKINSEQYESLTTIHDSDGHVIPFTNRDTQPLNGRPVYCNF